MGDLAHDIPLCFFIQSSERSLFDTASPVFYVQNIMVAFALLHGACFAVAGSMIEQVALLGKVWYNPTEGRGT